MEIKILDDLKIFLPEDYFISYINSPFPSHRNFQAIDIFPPERTLTEIKSPLDGRIVDHQIHIMRKNNAKEHVIILDAEKYYIKFLHVDPYYSVGEDIKSGQILGKLYISPYFRPWTDPHIHMEVRNKNDYLRARGALRIRVPNCKAEGNFSLLDEYEIMDNYILRKIVPIRCGDFFGAGDKGIIDGGFPHYKYGLLLGGEEAIFLNEKIGDVKTIENYNLITFYNKKIIFRNIEFLGIGFNIYLNKNAYIKYIFKNPADKKRL